jgi:hypothetical protein
LSGRDGSGREYEAAEEKRAALHLWRHINVPQNLVAPLGN